MLKKNDQVKIGLVEGKKNRLFGKTGTVADVWEQEPHDMLNVVIGKECFTLFSDEVERIDG